MRVRSLLVVVVTCSAILGFACGDDGGGDDGYAGGLSDEEQTYADAWAETLSDGDADDVQFSDEEATCLGEAVMAELGVEPFDEAGVEADEINRDGEEDDSPGEVLGAGVVSDSQADAILDAWTECADLAAALAGSLATEFDLDDEARECVAQGIEEEDLARDGYRVSFTSDDDTPPDDVLQELLAVVEGCGGTAVSDALTASIADALSADGTLTPAQATCLAQAVVEDLGADRLLALSGSGDFEDAPADVQAELGQALAGAAGVCDVPLDALGG